MENKEAMDVLQNLVEQALKQSACAQKEVKTLAREWGIFSASVMPHDAEKAQITGMKSSFYAGAICMFRLMTDIDVEDESDDAAVKQLNSLRNECFEYFSGMSEKINVKAE